MAELAKARVRTTARFSAYDLALKAQALFFDAVRLGSPETYRQAIATADEALAQDPRCTHALWVQGWAHAEAFLYRWGDEPERSLELGRAAMERFFEVDSKDSRGHMIRGVI